MAINSPSLKWSEHMKPSVLNRGHLGDEDEVEREERWRLKWKSFAIVYIAYTGYHFTRNNISAAKMGLKSDVGLTLGELGSVDTSFLTMYAMGQFISGAMADTWGPRATMMTGMIGSAACNLIIGLADNPSLELKVLWALNGIFQATGWACSLKVLSNWFPESERAFAVGAWCTNSSVGSIATAFLAGTIMSFFAWRGAFIIPALLVLGLAVVVYFGLYNDPEEVGMRHTCDTEVPIDEESPLLGSGSTGVKRMYLSLLTPDTTPLLTDVTVDSVRSLMNGGEAPLISMLKEPRVWIMGCGYFFVKLVRYSMWFWMPMYLHTVQGYSVQAATFAGSAFDIGGVIGLLIVGKACDKYMPHRARAASLGLLCLSGALMIFPTLAAMSPTMCVAGLMLCGLTLYAPDCIVAGASAQDIGGLEGTASAAGIINGLGSIGACFQGFVVSFIVTLYGWDKLFYFFSVSVLFAVVIMAPLSLKPWVVRSS